MRREPTKPDGEFAPVSYRQVALDERYDAIVIGSGAGGLTAAVLLSKHAAKRVLVLERHYTAGGFTHVFTRPGFEWDVGVHYIGQVQNRESQTRRIFDHLTDGRLQWSDMPDVYDRIFIGGQKYDFPNLWIYPNADHDSNLKRFFWNPESVESLPRLQCFGGISSASCRNDQVLDTPLLNGEFFGRLRFFCVSMMLHYVFLNRGVRTLLRPTVWRKNAEIRGLCPPLVSPHKHWSNRFACRRVVQLHLASGTTA